MTTAIVQRLGELMNRRVFLRRIALSVAGLIGLLQGSSGVAEALYACGCCWLCQPCNYDRCTGCACTWSWICVDRYNRFWRCQECYSGTSYCDGTCRAVICSQAQLAGDFPEAALAGV